MKKNSFTFKLTPDQQQALTRHLRVGNYRHSEIPHTIIAADGADCRIALYKSGKCLIQGKGAEDWVSFVLEPRILKEVRIGYDDVLHPEDYESHLGIDESGKGDYFGPLVIAAVFVDTDTVQVLRDLNVRDSKTITSDRKVEKIAGELWKTMSGRFNLVTIGPQAYNRLYASMRNVNHMLAWGHARAIENMLDKFPSCPRALSDQFGPARQIEKALLKNGRKIQLDQRPRAESDPAVAAASILARTAFLKALKKMEQEYGMPIPKGASDKVKETAGALIKKFGPEILLKTAKCHFKTTDSILNENDLDRSVLGQVGTARSK